MQSTRLLFELFGARLENRFFIKGLAAGRSARTSRHVNSALRGRLIFITLSDTFENAVKKSVWPGTNIFC
ncbi:hypothetical protein A3860_13840 [Niastella vici]|uniref:Uncharacterized protein n=1 Tax=Niastella vici TaxID=1703345 RepID=A0A1V9G7K1_9BACT|nr:hypothetical protein A3860_13840 [Niastella vici]